MKENEVTLDALAAEANASNGTHQERVILPQDVDIFFSLFNKHKNDPVVYSIRVYPAIAFVPMSYKYRAEVTVLQATRCSDGWFIGACRINAHRRYASGPRFTITRR